MDSRKVCIIGEEPILLYGLQEQFKNWGFLSIELIKASEFSLQMVNTRNPCLLLVVESGQKHNWLQLIEQMNHTGPIPTILLSTLKASMLYKNDAVQEGSHYIFLSKPCHIEDLKAAVERLLDIHIAA